MFANALVAGYLREYEQASTLEIPQVITSVISVYSKELAIKIIGKSTSNTSYTVDDLTMLNVSESTTFVSDRTSPMKHVLRGSTSPDIQMDDILKNTNDELIDIKTAFDHTLFLTLKGNVYAIGSNSSGALGLSQYIKNVNTPTLIPFQQKITAIATGKLHSLFLNEDGKLLVCGYNYCGQLGLGNHDTYSTLYVDKVTDCVTSNNKSVSASSQSTNNGDSCSQNNSTNFVCDSDSDSDSDSDDEWNDFKDKLLYVYKPIYNIYFDALDIKFIDISCGLYHSVCITTNGECFTFGHNGFGNLGNGEHSQWGTGVHIPYKLKINKEFKSSSCGKNHNILLTTNNEIIAWGDNRNNQCSIMNEKQFDSPYILSKKKELSVSDNCFAEQVICVEDKSILIIDVHKRIICA